MEKHKLLGKNKDMSTPARSRKGGAFQVDHLGRRTPDASTGRVMSRSHNDAAHGPHVATGKNIARDSQVGKHTHDIRVHGGMVSQSKSGAATYGGDHKSALDSVSGLAVVPGVIKSAPGWGNAGVQSGHPFAKVAQEKSAVGRTVPVHPASARNRAVVHDPGLTSAILSEALANSANDDNMALGRIKRGA